MWLKPKYYRYFLHYILLHQTTDDKCLQRFTSDMSSKPIVFFQFRRGIGDSVEWNISHIRISWGFVDILVTMRQFHQRLLNVNVREFRYTVRSQRPTVFGVKSHFSESGELKSERKIQREFIDERTEERYLSIGLRFWNSKERQIWQELPSLAKIGTNKISTMFGKNSFLLEAIVWFIWKVCLRHQTTFKRIDK